MPVSLYLFNNDRKKELCIDLTKRMLKACFSIKQDDIEKCTKLMDNYKKFCTYK